MLKLSSLLTFSIVTVNIILTGVQFVLTSDRASDGQKITTVQKQLVDLKYQNNQLQNLIYTYTSLSYLKQKAQTFNLFPAKLTQLSPLTVAQTAMSTP